MSGLGRRVVTALVYGALVLLAIAGPWPTFVVLLLALFALALAEIARMARWRPARVLTGALYIGLGLAGLAVLWAAGSAHAAHELPIGVTALGITAPPVWLLLALLPTWAADIGAYFGGSLFGRRKIAPRISPGKTWEGTFTGFAAAALAVFGVAAFFGLPRTPAAIAAVGIGPVAFAGDLFESWLKRRAGVKDSGSLLPGHGGVLDRIDSLLFVAPFVVVVLWLADRMR